MTRVSHLKQVTSWLADLANLTAGNAPLADFEAKIMTLASMLAENYPPGAFCRASLDEVASGCRFFPAYSEIRTLLGKWWIEHRPADSIRAIAAPSGHIQTLTERLGREPTESEIRAERARYNHPDGPTDEAMAAVRSVVQAFVAERSFNRPSAIPSKVLIESHPLNDMQLLAQYTRLAKEGDRSAGHRLAMLRARLNPPPPMPNPDTIAFYDDPGATP